MLQPFKHTFFLLSIIGVTLSAVSCTSTKQVVYLNDLSDTTTGSLSSAQINFENPIQKNDQLWIMVGGSNPLDLIALNSANGIGTGTTATVAPTMWIGNWIPG